ncbi:MAG: thiamine phosphate synthase [Lapillicoccus sp.]
MPGSETLGVAPGRTLVDLRLYLVTDPGFPDVARVALAGVAGGVTCVQVRDKDDTDRLRATSLSLRRALPTHITVVANDDLEVAGLVDGIHVGVDDVPPARARRLLGEHAVVGWSVNRLEQLDDRVALEACDYLAVSPVWSTPTKTDTTAPLGLDGVRAVADRLRQIGWHRGLVGIGGISERTAASVVEAGASGVAVVSAVGAAADPTQAARRLRAEVDRALSSRPAAGAGT